MNETDQGLKVDIDANKTKEVKGEQIGLFRVKTANAWMDEAEMLEPSKMLFSEFWQDGEFCFLFADTNTGKSALAVQIADSITMGKAIKGFKLEADRQPVMYFDFELSSRQFYKRYTSDAKQISPDLSEISKYEFNDLFYRIQIDPKLIINYDGKIPYEEFLYQSIESVIVERGAKIVIVDNITYLNCQTTERAEFALPLMKYLMGLREKYSLSILVLAHVPKRDLSKSITRNDMGGSKHLINFCDSAFTIGEDSADGRIRYLKQIKCRSSEIIYDSKNVMTCRLHKPDNFLQFEFLQFSDEADHLRPLTDEDRQAKRKQAQDMKDQGVSNRDIGKRLCISEGAVRYWFKQENA